MDIETVKQLLLWCFVINYGFLILWFLFFVLGRSLMYGLHSRWFSLTPERFDNIHYAGMALLKIATLIFFLAPYIALRIVTG